MDATYTKKLLVRGEIMPREDMCCYDHYDCFALQKNGICKALRDTDFDGMDCPFYKSKAQVEKENKENKRK